MLSGRVQDETAVKGEVLRTEPMVSYCSAAVCNRAGSPERLVGNDLGLVLLGGGLKGNATDFQVSHSCPWWD